LFSSAVGVLILLVLYAGNLFAAREVAVFRGRPVAVVCGVAAVAPIVGPILFLAMRTQRTGHEEPAAAQQQETQLAANPLAATPAEIAAAETAAGHGAHLRLADTPKAEAGAVPEPQIFQRGAFTFNRRFFETRFAGFFGMIRRDADKDMVLVIKSTRGHYTAQRITRIAAADVHVQVHGASGEEVMVPFSEIQEIQLKHKDT
jgi:hypothetical protein